MSVLNQEVILTPSYSFCLMDNNAELAELNNSLTTVCRMKGENMEKYIGQGETREGLLLYNQRLPHSVLA